MIVSLALSSSQSVSALPGHTLTDYTDSGDKRMAKAKTKVAKRPFGYKEIALDKETYGLDEDGYIWIRSRLKVKDAFQATNIDEDNIDVLEWLSKLIGGWSVKMDGVELPYDLDNMGELPIEILSLVQQEVTVPLEQAQTVLPAS
jgi:hypothetical protein